MEKPTVQNAKIIILSLAAILLASIPLFVNLADQAKNETGGLVLKIDPESKTLTKGERLEMSIFVEGNNIDDISVIEIDLETNPDGLGVISASYGGLLGENPIEAKRDLANGHFIFIKNPELKDIKTSPDKPLLILTLSPSPATENAGFAVSFSQNTRAYLKGKGAEFIRSGGAVYTLKNE